MPGIKKKKWINRKWPNQLNSPVRVASVEGHDGLEKPQPEKKDHLVATRASDLVEPLQVSSVAPDEGLLGLEEPLLSVGKLRHVTQLEVAPRDVQVKKT